MDGELGKLKVFIKIVDEEIADNATEAALKYGIDFPFRHHARDYVIGVTALAEKASLITNNTQHFDWLKKEGVAVRTPETLVAENL